MQGFKTFMMVVGLLALVTGGIGTLAGAADPGSDHNPHGKQPHAGMGYGNGDHEGMGRHGGLSILAMKELLGLSNEQVNQLRPLELEYRKTMIQNGAALRIAMVDLGMFTDAKKTDMAAIACKVDEISLLQKKMMCIVSRSFCKSKTCCLLSNMSNSDHSCVPKWRGRRIMEGKNKRGKNVMATTQINLMAMMVG